MFFERELEHTVMLHPKFFGPSLEETVRAKCQQEVEGKCSGRYGWVVCVHEFNADSIGDGRVIEGNAGYAAFNVTYRAIVFRPFKGEVLDATVKTVNKMGFFCEAGPLQMFVSTHLIPDYMSFQIGATGEPSYSDEDGEFRIRPGSECRVKIVGTRIDSNEIFAVATIKDDYLGLIA